MPELPEVETTRQGILPYCEGQVVKKISIREQRLRWPISEELSQKISGQIIQKIERRSKYLLWHFKHGVMLMHLGMSGALRVLEQFESPQKHDHVDVELASGKIIRFTDPRRFGAILWTTDIAAHRLLMHLGPEPLTTEFNSEYLHAKLKSIKRAIKLVIMDAHVVVGVGNIYANEALFLAKIKPERVAGSLSMAEVKTLVEKIKITLERAIRAGGTTLRDFLKTDGSPGYFAQELLVYGRGGEPCVDCDALLIETRLGQRSTVFCKHCQK